MATFDLLSAEELFKQFKSHIKIVFSKNNPVFSHCIFKMKTGFTEIISDPKNHEPLNAVLYDNAYMLQYYGRLF